MPLTNIAIKNAKPKTRPFKVFDERGLYLHVHPHGTKLWRFKYRLSGKEKLLALGRYPDVSLKMARERRDDARRLLAEGRDPSAERQAEKHKARLKAADSFETVAREFIERQSNRWSASHAENWRRRFTADIFSHIGDRPISEIDTPELLTVLRQVEERGVYDHAHRLLRRCGQVFRYAIATGRCDRNPAADLKGALTPHKGSHMPAISPSELPELLAAIDGYSGFPTTRLALQFLAVTFVRTKELTHAQKDEIDFENAMWTVAAPRMKLRDPFLVPLSRQAIAVIEEASDFNTGSPFLFPGRNSPLKPISDNTMLMALYRVGFRGRMCGHGFRTVASTILNEQTEFNPDAIELQLDHRERDAARRAYNRARRLDERRTMMDWWADHLDSLRGGNVITAQFGKSG